MHINRKRASLVSWRLLLAALLLTAMAGLPAARCQANGDAPAPATATQASATGGAQPAAAVPALDDLMPAYRSDVERLASPEFEGRRIGEPGAELAAQYLEQRLQAIGVEALPNSRGYRSGFSVTRGITVTGTPSASLNGSAWTLGTDYAVAAFTGSGKLDSAPVVFASYGITAPELKWDDYAGIDAKGAVVVILRGEPQEADTASAFAGDQPTVYSDLRRKAANARDHGAVALLIVDQPAKNPDDKLAEVHPQYSAASFNLPVLHVRRALLQNALIGGTGLSFAEMTETIDLESQPHSAVLTGSQFSIDLAVEKDMATGFNLVGIIPGADETLKGQYVALGAHYDHIGLGGPESMAKDSYGQVHPGADDDASGVAGVLAVAAWAMQHRSELKRSLLVCHFLGRGRGLARFRGLHQEPACRAGQHLLPDRHGHDRPPARRQAAAGRDRHGAGVQRHHQRPAPAVRA